MRHRFRPSGLSSEQSVKPGCPPAPPLFTTATDCPISFSRKGAKIRAATSLLPPAAHATLMATDPLGFQAATVGATVGAVVATDTLVGAIAAGLGVGGIGVGVGDGAQAELTRMVSAANKLTENRVRGFIFISFLHCWSGFVTSLWCIPGCVSLLLFHHLQFVAC